MRVFEDYYFNLKKTVLFKDTKHLLDDFLAENGITYEGLCFDFESGNFEKLLQKYPVMQKYYEDGKYGSGRLTSVAKNWDECKNICIDKQDEPMLDEILTKIPRPYNAANISVLLYNVDWNKEGRTRPSNYEESAGNKDVRPGYRLNYSCYCNGIFLIKEFDYGTKVNPFICRVERTGTFDELKPVPEVIERLKERFSKPFRVKSICINDKEVYKASEDNKQKFKKEFNDKDLYDKYLAKYEGEEYETEELLEPVKDFSPKKEMIKCAKRYGFSYAGCSVGMYQLKRINKHNHIFVVQFLIRPFYSLVEFDAFAEGYNFFYHFNKSSHLIKTAADFAEFLEDAFEYTENAIDRYEDRLFELNGRSPAWYAENRKNLVL